MRKNPTYALLAVGLVLCMPTVLAGKPPPTATAVVDCTDPDPKKHGSISEALATPAEALTIEIRGICIEDVVISRDDVTLRGADRMTDGLRGAAPPPGDTVIFIDRADNVRLEELAVLAGNRNGVWITDAAGVEVSGCRILDHPRIGLSSNRGLRISDTVITGIGLAALITEGVTFVSGSEFEAAAWAVNGTNSGGFLGIRDSVIRSAGVGVLSDLGGYVALTNTDVEAPEALRAWRGDIHMNGGELGDGYLVATQKSSISLSDVSQPVNAAGAHYADSDSLLRLIGTTSLNGTPHLDAFSNLSIEGQSIVDGDLICRTGSDAFCEDPATSLTGSSNCGQCLKP